MISDTFLREVIAFFDISLWIAMIQSNDYSYLLTPEGFLNAIRPILTLVLLFEIAQALILRRFKGEQTRVLFVTYVVNRVFANSITLSTAALATALLAPLAPFSLRITWWGFVYAYFVYELGHYIFHFSAHKVRLLWCLHSTHHAPEQMSLMVTFSQFFFQNFYVGFVRVGTCALLGVSPALFGLVFACDRIYGNFVHISEGTLKDGRFGWLESWILTPAHHRVHHARNPIYVDRNFCNLLPVWDRLFGTYQRQLEDVPIEYGLNRKVNANSFVDTYFGEIVLLARDVWRAPGLKNKLLYLMMPPGWSHTGQHATATTLRKTYLLQRSASPVAAAAGS